MKELSKKRLKYLLAIMKKNSIEYSVVNNSYCTRLIPEIHQACNQIYKLIKNQKRLSVSDKDMSTKNLIIHFSEGKYECPLCHRKFNVFNKIKKNIWERRMWADYISNRPNAERHLKACEKLTEELRYIINPLLKKPKPRCREGYD